MFVTLYCAMKIRFVAWAVAIFAALPGPLWAVEAAPPISDREIVERLTRVETHLDGIDARLDGIDTRLDGLDGRIDRIETRLDEGLNSLRTDMNSQFDRLNNILIGMTAVFGGLVVVCIGLVFRTQKTASQPSATSTKRLDSIDVTLRDFGEINPDFAAILKRRPTL